MRTDQNTVLAAIYAHALGDYVVRSENALNATRTLILFIVIAVGLYPPINWQQFPPHNYAGSMAIAPGALIVADFAPLGAIATMGSTGFLWIVVGTIALSFLVETVYRRRQAWRLPGIRVLRTPARATSSNFAKFSPNVVK